MISKYNIKTFFKSVCIVIDSDANALKPQNFDISLPNSNPKYCEIKAISYHTDATNNKALHMYKINISFFEDDLYIHSNNDGSFMIFENLKVKCYDNFTGRFTLYINGISNDNTNSGSAYYSPIAGSIIIYFLFHYE